jgi:hypothetical protein
LKVRSTEVGTGFTTDKLSPYRARYLKLITHVLLERSFSRSRHRIPFVPLLFYACQNRIFSISIISFMYLAMLPRDSPNTPLGSGPLPSFFESYSLAYQAQQAKEASISVTINRSQSRFTSDQKLSHSLCAVLGVAGIPVIVRQSLSSLPESNPSLPFPSESVDCRRAEEGFLSASGRGNDRKN